jgi:inorganic pyrophosphatase/exopolyphosphatase
LITAKGVQQGASKIAKNEENLQKFIFLSIFTADFKGFQYGHTSRLKSKFDHEFSTYLYKENPLNFFGRSPCPI